MGTLSQTFSVLGCLLWLSWTTVVYCLFGPPCMSQLGLRHNHSDHIVTFDLFVSDGDAADMRLNGPKAWRPPDVTDSFLQINISQPVLLTGIQVQGDPGRAGRVSAWTLETSLDCTNYKTENYSIDFPNPSETHNVLLKNMEFVACVRLSPTEYMGKMPALRLELLGCVVSDAIGCHRDVHPVTEIWMVGGGRQLNFDHEVVVSWVKALLEMQVHGDTGDVGIFYSQSCDRWKFVEPMSTNTLSITSADSKSKWITVELDTPVRARCLRVFPPLAAKLKEVHTNACSSRVTSELHQLNSDTKSSLQESEPPLKDVTAYQEDSPDALYHMESKSETQAKIVSEKSSQELEKDKLSTTILDSTVSTSANEKPAILNENSATAPQTTKSTQNVRQIISTATITNNEVVNEVVTMATKAVTEQTTINQKVDEKDSAESMNSASMEITKEITTSKVLLSTENATTDETLLYQESVDEYLTNNNSETTQRVVNSSASESESESNSELPQNDQLLPGNEPELPQNDLEMPQNDSPEHRSQPSAKFESDSPKMNSNSPDIDSEKSESELPEKDSKLNHNASPNSDYSQDTPLQDLPPSSNAEMDTDTSLQNSTDVEEDFLMSNTSDYSNSMVSDEAVNNSASGSNSTSLNEEDPAITEGAPLNGIFFDSQELEGNGKSKSADQNQKGTDSSDADATKATSTPSCGVREPLKDIRRKRVVGGHMNVPFEWPWLASMHFLPEFEFTRRSGFKHACGASLIAPNWIITAAHCFSDVLVEGLANVSNWKIYFGLHDLARKDGDQSFIQERLVKAVYSYPKFDLTIAPLIYDIAVVKLNESVEINKKVSPVCLDDSDRHYNSSHCHVTGWGQITPDSPGSRYPYSAALTTLEQDKCKAKYDSLPDDHPVKPYVHIKPPVMCATVGKEGEDACQGDSGGPLMCEHEGLWYQAGIVAAGFECGHEAYPGLYTRVKYYIDWIRKIMELHAED